MPECIVCKGHYEPGQPCERCQSDNSPWDDWRRNRAEEQGGIEGLLAFYRPYVYLPFFTLTLALAFGLMGVGGLWKGITPAAQLLALAVTVCGCLVTALSAYGMRHDIREQALLNRVQRGGMAFVSNIQFRTMLVPVSLMLLVILSTYAMISSDVMWELAKPFLLDPAYRQEVEQQETPSEEMPEEVWRVLVRMRQVTPFLLMGMYVAFIILFNSSVAYAAAMVYAQEVNRAVPKPIFLQEERLAQVVRRQAEHILSQPVPLRAIGDAESQTSAIRGTKKWTWDEMERTPYGGVKLTARVECEDSPVEESITGHRTKYPELIDYFIEANPWGRITRITRGERSSRL